MKTVIAAPTETERDQAQVLADLATQRIALAAAEHALDELGVRRSAMLATASIDEVVAVDAAIARAATAVDVASARIAPLESELARLRAADRLAGLVANLRRAHALRKEAEQLIAEYASHAEVIAEALLRLAEISVEVGRLNYHLPPGVAHVQVEPPRYASATLGTSVRLPGVTAYAADFWPSRPRTKTAAAPVAASECV